MTLRVACHVNDRKVGDRDRRVAVFRLRVEDQGVCALVVVIAPEKVISVRVCARERAAPEVRNIKADRDVPEHILGHPSCHGILVVRAVFKDLVELVIAVDAHGVDAGRIFFKG